MSEITALRQMIRGNHKWFSWTPFTFEMRWIRWSPMKAYFLDSKRCICQKRSSRDEIWKLPGRTRIQLCKFFCTLAFFIPVLRFRLSPAQPNLNFLSKLAASKLFHVIWMKLRSRFIVLGRKTVLTHNSWHRETRKSSWLIKISMLPKIFSYRKV